MRPFILALGAGNAAILVHPYDLPTGALGNLTADAVGIEPVSYPNSLLTGKFTGKSSSMLRSDPALAANRE
jgi:hypothetical protein